MRVSCIYSVSSNVSCISRVLHTVLRVLSLVNINYVVHRNLPHTFVVCLPCVQPVCEFSQTSSFESTNQLFLLRESVASNFFALRWLVYKDKCLQICIVAERGLSASKYNALQTFVLCVRSNYLRRTKFVTQTPSILSSLSLSLSHDTRFDFQNCFNPLPHGRP